MAPMSVAPTESPTTLTPTAEPNCYSASQVSGPVSLLPFETASDVFHFYFPSGSQGNSFSGIGITPLADTVLVMLHRDLRTGQDSVVIVIDGIKDGTSGDVDLVIENVEWGATVHDDVNETPYSYDANLKKINAGFKWAQCCTDGIAAPISLTTASPCVKITLLLDNGISSLKTLSGPFAPGTPNDFVTALPLDICKTECV